jgi:LemA protein
MKTWQIVLIVILVIILLLGFSVYRFFKNNYNNFVTVDEGVKAAWAQVENQYQRRYDLIPNLVETVKGYASHEKETLEGVVKARAKMGGMVNIGKDAVNNPQLMQQFQQAQSGLGAALQRLMVVVERYPDLKANQNFLELQAQLEGTENRISVERRRYNETVKNYNTAIRKFPQKIVANMFGFQRAILFKMDEAAKEAPKVKF